MTTIGVRHVTFRREVADVPYDPGATTLLVTPVFDGHTLVEWIAFVTSHDGTDWWGLPDGDDVPALLRGTAGRDFPPALDGASPRAELLVCSCTVSGCHPLLVAIHVDDDRVVWQGLSAGNGEPGIDGIDHGLLDVEFTFPRDEYDRAVTACEDWAEPIVDLRG